MKKNIAITLAFLCMLILTGCGIPEKVKGIDLPFEASDIGSVEVYHYDGVPAAAEVKIVTGKKDIVDLWELFESIPLEVKEVEEYAGASVTIFRFHLSDNTEYEITYVGNGVMNGTLKSSTGNFEYFTKSDVGGFWLKLSYEAEAADLPE